MTNNEQDRARQASLRLEQIIRSIREIMRKDAGLSSELDRVPQLSWLLFLKAFDAMESIAESEDPNFRRAIDGAYRWNQWVHRFEKQQKQRGEKLLKFVNEDLLPHLRSLSGPTIHDSRTILSSVFVETQNRMLSGNLLRDVILKIDEIDFTSPHDVHIMAFLYEGLLKDVRDAAGSAGEFYTPRPLIKFMVQQTFLSQGNTILDPACGTGGFLVEAYVELANGIISPDERKTIAGCMRGIEKKPFPFLLCTMNLLLHGMNQSVVSRENALLAMPNGIRAGYEVDAVLTNPPFGGEEEVAVFGKFHKEYRTRETSWLFLVTAMDALSFNGKCAIVVPNSVLFDESVGYAVKRRFEREFNLHTVVRLPEGVFAPYTKIPSNLLFFERGKPTREVWFYQIPVAHGGKAYTKKRPLRDADLLECQEWWGGSERTGRVESEWAWRVPVDDLVAKRWNMDMVHPVHLAASHGSPGELLNRFRESNSELQRIIELLAERGL